MDTNSLLYFAEAAKDLNFTRTAKRLFISQQNLSNHISRLEDYYRVKLFERKPHLALTYSGEVLLAYANNFKMDEDNLKNVLSDIHEKERGTLRIGCSPVRSSIVMPILSEIFNRDYPNVELHLYQQHSNELSEMLLSGTLDFAISVDKIFHPNLISTHLFTDTMFLMVSRNLLYNFFGDQTDSIIEEAQNGASLKTFEALPFVNVRSTSIVQDCFETSGCTPNFIVTTSFPQYTMPNYYERMAASIVTRTIYLHIREHISDNILFFPLITSPVLSLHDISFIRHKRKYLTKYGQHFLDITSKYFKNLEAQA